MWDKLPIWLQVMLTMVIGFAVFMGVGVGIYYLFHLKPIFLLLWGALAFVGGKPTGEVIVIIIK